jgi:hypothetical protein
MTWTDERLDDAFARIDQRFDAVDREIRDLRTEMHTGFRELRGEMASLRRQCLAVAIGMGGIQATALVAIALNSS